LDSGILLPQSPKMLRLQVCNTVPGFRQVLLDLNVILKIRKIFHTIYIKHKNQDFQCLWEKWKV
jgi:D-ribose pyranose/furanose isomerase RbsD